MLKQSLILRQKAQQSGVDNIQDSFELISQKINPPAEGLLMQTRYISIDPIMRVWLSQAKTYLPRLEIGDVIHCFALSSPIHNPNDIYFGPTGLQTHFIYDQRNKDNQLIRIPRSIISRLTKSTIDVGHLLTIILNGLPAYYGLVDFCKIKKGNNVLVSTAAGATGLFCIQLALHYECNVIGLTSSQEKVSFLKKNFPKLKVVSYKDPDWEQELFKDGIDSYFDNVGEYMLDAVLPKMKNFGKLALCGSMVSSSNYNQRQGLLNHFMIIQKRLKLKGITFNQELDKIQAAFDSLLSLLAEGKLKIFVESYHGLEAVPQALKRLFKGENIGKLIVQLDKSKL